LGPSWRRPRAETLANGGAPSQSELVLGLDRSVACESDAAIGERPGRRHDRATTADRGYARRSVSSERWWPRWPVGRTWFRAWSR